MHTAKVVTVRYMLNIARYGDKGMIHDGCLLGFNLSRHSHTIGIHHSTSGLGIVNCIEPAQFTGVSFMNFLSLNSFFLML